MTLPSLKQTVQAMYQTLCPALWEGDVLLRWAETAPVSPGRPPRGPPLSAPPGPAGGAVFHTLSIFENIWGASCVSCPFFPGAAPAFLHFAPLRNR